MCTHASIPGVAACRASCGRITGNPAAAVAVDLSVTRLDDDDRAWIRS